MTETRNLSSAEFDALFAPGMQNVTQTGDAVVDIWSYVDAIPETNFVDVIPHDVHYVFRTTDGSHDHVIVATCVENVELVVVVNRDQRSIVGHHLLDLNALYDLPR